MAPLRLCVVQTAALPAKGSDEEHILLGKDLFNTGRARWSLNGQGWGACQSCHSDGLIGQRDLVLRSRSASVDLARRQLRLARTRSISASSTTPPTATSLQTSRSTRATPRAASAPSCSPRACPPVNLDRLDTPALKLAELDGSSLLASDPANPLGLGFDETGKVVVGQLQQGPHGEVCRRVCSKTGSTSRATRRPFVRRARPTNLDKAKVAAGEQLFVHAGSCQGCHGGDKWTVSKLFYTPGVDDQRRPQGHRLRGAHRLPRPACLPAEDRLRLRSWSSTRVANRCSASQRNVKTFNKAEDGVGHRRGSRQRT